MPPTGYTLDRNTWSVRLRTTDGLCATQRMDNASRSARSPILEWRRRAGVLMEPVEKMIFFQGVDLFERGCMCGVNINVFLAVFGEDAQPS